MNNLNKSMQERLDNWNKRNEPKASVVKPRDYPQSKAKDDGVTSQEEWEQEFQNSQRLK